jgi:ABC-type sugar transport system substrate-binding protein
MDGIVVVTHEASNQKNMDYDVEAFDNKAFGAGLMDRLAEKMGKKVSMPCLWVASAPKPTTNG